MRIGIGGRTQPSDVSVAIELSRPTIVIPYIDVSWSIPSLIIVSAEGLVPEDLVKLLCSDNHHSTVVRCLVKGLVDCTYVTEVSGCGNTVLYVCSQVCILEPSM